ncbi:Hypp2701 [Branchiostoma lanceolatum]|uniref:Hypp2701 protein n=1 Tax=Branchiostoma lanceolatum TaxID=7740 RepID=A0A8J9ZYF2_BRALA|nr:Hypp2701 [Branchiostoma lanceolatum]
MFAARGALAGTRAARERRRKISELRDRERRRRQRRLRSVIIQEGTVKICSLPTVCILLGVLACGAGTVMSMVSYDFLQVDFLMTNKNHNNITRNEDQESAEDFDRVRRIQEAFFPDVGYSDNVHILGRGTNYPPQFRLVGPLLIGGGIFIVLCGITALLENRDGETVRAPLIVLEPAPEQSGRPSANFDLLMSNSCPNFRYLPEPVSVNQQRGYLKHPPSPAPLRSSCPQRDSALRAPAGLDLGKSQHLNVF